MTKQPRLATVAEQLARGRPLVFSCELRGLAHRAVSRKTSGVEVDFDKLVDRLAAEASGLTG